MAGQAHTVGSHEVSASSLVPLSAQLSSGVECRQPNTRLRPPYGTTVSKIGINFMCSHNSYVLTSLCFSRLHVLQSSMVLTVLCSSKLYDSHGSMFLKALRYSRLYVPQSSVVLTALYSHSSLGLTALCSHSCMVLTAPFSHGFMGSTGLCSHISMFPLLHLQTAIVIPPQFSVSR